MPRILSEVDTNQMNAVHLVGVGIRGTLGDIDPLNKVLFRRARSRVKKGPVSGVSLILPRTQVT